MHNKLLPLSKPVPKERKPGPVMGSLRKFIISRRPFVEYAARRMHRRIYVEMDKLKAFGDFSMRAGRFQSAKELYRNRLDWKGMAIAQDRAGDTEGALETLNSKCMFSRSSAKLFLDIIHDLNSTGNSGFNGQVAQHLSAQKKPNPGVFQDDITTSVSRVP
jgi:hypothetical protein